MLRPSIVLYCRIVVRRKDREKPGYLLYCSCELISIAFKYREPGLISSMNRH